MAVSVDNFPHHSNDLAAAIIVEDFIELTRKMIEIDCVTIDCGSFFEHASHVTIVEPEFGLQNSAERLSSRIDNAEKALGYKPVRIGEEGKLVYVYRGDVANNALKLAGNELGLFVEKAQVTHKREFEDLSDLQIVEEIQREAQLLLEHHSREMAEKSVEDVGFQGKTRLGSRRR